MWISFHFFLPDCDLPFQPAWATSYFQKNHYFAKFDPQHFNYCESKCFHPNKPQSQIFYIIFISTRKWSLTGGGLVKAIALQGVSFKICRCQSIILLHVISQLCTCVVPCCHWMFFVYSVWCSIYSEQRDHTMCQVVAYKRLKTMENVITVRQERGSNYIALTGKNLCFW